MGWEIGSYVKDALEFGLIMGTATKGTGAVLLTASVARMTLPAGIMAGATAGRVVGVAAGIFKESLEKLVSKK